MDDTRRLIVNIIRKRKFQRTIQLYEVAEELEKLENKKVRGGSKPGRKAIHGSRLFLTKLYTMTTLKKRYVRK
jgi:hypothetical protein